MQTDAKELEVEGLPWLEGGPKEQSVSNRLGYF
jgi:hypothetical protein